MAKKKWTFEQAMEKLEQIVEQLETQEVSLEESVQLYKEGMALADICKQKITMAKSEVLLLQKNVSGEVEKIPFELGEENNA